jgi:hypothetical protein
MRFSVQTESPTLLGEALASGCQGIRFGPEFCESKIPRLETLKKALEETEKKGKSFSYVTPLLTNVGVEELQKHFDYLEGLGDMDVVAGDLGALRLLQDYKDLHPRLGRPRVYMPARSPWPQITRMPDPSYLTRRRVEGIFYQTGLNYRRSLDFYRTCGVVGADIDWVPKSFPYFRQVAEAGFKLAVYTYAVPVTITGRCHTARFLGEKDPALCTQPCLGKAFTLKQREIGMSFMLQGNVLFRLVEHHKKDMKELLKMRVDEIVLPMGPVSKLKTAKDVDQAIAAFSARAA